MPCIAASPLPSRRPDAGLPALCRVERRATAQDQHLESSLLWRLKACVSSQSSGLLATLWATAAGSGAQDHGTGVGPNCPASVGTSRHRPTLLLPGDLLKRRRAAPLVTVRHARGPTLNPRFGGSSPSRRTPSDLAFRPCGRRARVVSDRDRSPSMSTGARLLNGHGCPPPSGPSTLGGEQEVNLPCPGVREFCWLWRSVAG